MDAQKLILSVFLLALLTACQPSKSVETVFPESQNGPDHACTGMDIDGEYLVAWENGSISVENFESNKAIIESLIEPQISNIRYVEKNKKLFINPENEQLPSFAGDLPTDWHIQQIEAQNVWSQGYQGQSVKVAVIDSGTYYHHPQILPRIAQNLAEANGVTGVDDDGNGYVDDIYGWDFFDDQAEPTIPTNRERDHGTHVAGTVLADPNFGPVKGVAPQAQLIPIKFLDAEEGGTIDKAIPALKYAAARGAKIINASWGGTGCSSLLRESIANLSTRGILFVAAAGNNGVDADRSPSLRSYPASFSLPNIISVASARSSGIMSYFSNYGFTHVHIAAPGDPIYSTVKGGSNAMSGTSMASPVVAGVAALLWSAKPQATYEQIRTAILRSVVSINGFQYAVSSRGHINARRALEELNRIVP